MKINTVKQANKAGLKARKEGKTAADNPCTEGTIGHRAWLMGLNGELWERV